MMLNPPAILVALLSVAACLASPAASADPVPEDVTIEKRVWLSNIDVQEACKQQYTDAYVAITSGNGCGDWNCVLNNHRYSVNMDAYCVRRFGGDVYAACGGGTVWDWQCHDRR